MYFECVSHEVRQVESVAEAAKLAKSGNVPSYVALSWSSDNGTFYAVSGAHIDDCAFGETAIIKQEPNGFTQKESITVAWIKTVREVERCFAQSETSEHSRSVSFIIGKPTNQTANFTCGCCGENFRDSVKKQLTFDQDNGYGICGKCEQYYT